MRRSICTGDLCRQERRRAEAVMRRHNIGRTVVRAVTATCFAAALAGPAWAIDAAIDFGRDVLPILAGHCFQCHGSDEEFRKADLRLDTADGIAATLVAGKPDESEFVRRIESGDPDEMMPPPATKKPLSEEQKLILRRWVKQGAAWGRHWAFEPTVRPEPPAVKNQAWVRNPIDRFVLAKLEAEGLAPAPEASRETLVRRLFLDLTGLPPTPGDVAAFVADTKPDAYTRLVERLLASDHHAERLAQQWLDLARYADTWGYSGDDPRTAWPWRDWVLEAFKTNMPFDQFVIEQLAGDLLENPTQSQKIATGFHANAMMALGNTYDYEEYRTETIYDRVGTTGTALLGLTVGCARCHDHVFDPVTQKDYFKLFAIFNNIPHEGKYFGVHGPRLDLGFPDKSMEEKREAIVAEIKRLEETPAEPAAGAASLAELRIDGAKAIPTWKTIGKPAWDGESPPDRQGASASFDGASALQAPNAADFAFVGKFRIACAIKTTDPVADIVSKYDWTAAERSFAFGIGGEGDRLAKPGFLCAWVSSNAKQFTGVQIFSSIMVADGQWHDIALEFEPGTSIRLVIDGKVDEAAVVLGEPPPVIAVTPRPILVGAGYRNGQPDFHYTGLLHGLSISGEVGSPTNPASKELKTLRKQMAEIDKQRVIADVMAELPQPRDTFIHKRGNYNAPGDKVEPGVPEMLGALPAGAPANRLGLAQWLVSGTHPLTARVAANRLWSAVMGVGLVRTPGDFGTRGEPPTHRALLDWLAAELVASGWDQRHVVRLIATSAAYRQSSDASAELVARDPANLLLARATRRRLDAEQIRDVALAASGLLNRSVGGPSVKPDMPAHLFDDLVPVQSDAPWKPSPGSARHRRSLYVTWKRMLLNPTLATFDAPSREVCVAQRVVTNTPLQSFVLLNDHAFVEAAVALAARVLAEHPGDDAARLDAAMRIVVSRSPSPRELETLGALLADMRTHYTADAAAAQALIGPKAPAVKDVPPPELAAWTVVASTVLNLDEAISRQ
jgi:mono/diheme cytochrome c family protein